MDVYSNAFQEVYVILNALEEAYNKIPKSLLRVFEEDRNKEYKYVLDENKPLAEHEMLRETRAILFNVFRDYLSTLEQKDKIIKMQAEERNKNEEIKRKNYDYAHPVKEKVEDISEEKTEIDLVKVETKETLWMKLKKRLNVFFRKRSL